MTNRHRKAASGGGERREKGREGEVERVQAGCNLSFMLWRHVNCSLSLRTVASPCTTITVEAPTGVPCTRWDIQRKLPLHTFALPHLLDKELSIIINCTDCIYIHIVYTYVYWCTCLLFIIYRLLKLSFCCCKLFSPDHAHTYALLSCGKIEKSYINY